MNEKERKPGLLAEVAGSLANLVTGGELSRLRRRNVELSSSNDGYRSRNERLAGQVSTLQVSRGKAYDQRDRWQREANLREGHKNERDAAIRERDEARAEAQTAAEKVRAIAQEKYEVEAKLHDQVYGATNALRDLDLFGGHAAKLYDCIRRLTSEQAQASAEVQERIDAERDQASRNLEAERSNHSEMYGDLEDRHNLALAEIEKLKGEVAAKERSIETLERRFQNVVRERDEARNERDRLRGAVRRGRR